MEEFKIKKGKTFETADGTLLQVKSYDERSISFYEFSYNDFMCEFNILLDDNRILSYNEVKNLLHSSYGKNFKLIFEN